jgi:hypothetical protein
LGSRPPSPAAALAATTKSTSQSGAGNGAGSKPNRRCSGGDGGSGGGGGSEGSGGPTQQHHTIQQQPQQQAGGAKPVSLPSGGWPTVYNPWTGTIQLWSGARHPPLAPIPRPPQLQLYQLPPAPPGASEVGQWGPTDRLLQPHGRPPFLGYTVARLRVQHDNTEPAFIQRVVF